MKVDYHKTFLKHFEKRILPDTKLVAKFNKRLDLFLKDSKHPSLVDHKLTGQMKDYHAFSVTGDIRVVYKVEGETVRLYDIGSHNQVY